MYIYKIETANNTLRKTTLWNEITFKIERLQRSLINVFTT